MSSEGFKSDDPRLATYQVGDVAAPSDFNPDATGMEDPTPGKHMMYVRDYELHPDQSWTWKGQTYVLDQLRVQLACCPEDSQPNASIIAFIPMPPVAARNQSMPDTGMLNQWANFIKSIGFDIPDGKVVPAGFQLTQIKGINRRAIVAVEKRTDKDGNVITKDNGEPRMAVKFFGFSRPDVVGSLPSATARKTTESPNDLEL